MVEECRDGDRSKGRGLAHRRGSVNKSSSLPAVAHPSPVSGLLGAYGSFSSVLGSRSGQGHIQTAEMT